MFHQELFAMHSSTYFWFQYLRQTHFPDRSGVYLQCHAVYTADPLQLTQCTCSIGCSYTIETLQTAVYTVPTLYIHCIYTVAMHLHCQQVAVYVQCICSLHCRYTETILPIHSTSVWVGAQ